MGITRYSDKLDLVDNPSDFNDKYNDQLEDRHYGLAIYDEDVCKFLDVLFHQLKQADIEFTYAQIKMKYGSSRFYSSLPSAMNEAIEAKINSIIKYKEEQE